MLNVYQYYDHPETLARADELQYVVSRLHTVAAWGTTIQAEDLELVKNTIKQDPQLAYQYCARILKGPWTDAEPYIMKDPNSAYRYAKFIKLKRWPEAEEYIKEDPMIWDAYKHTFKLESS